MNELVAWLDDPWRLSFIVSLACLHPLWRIFRRAGLSPWPALLVFVPVFGLTIVGSVLAFRRWPNVAPRKPKQR
ncbi:MAG TPA: hypothetical protein VKZ79_03755 [Alphaproteobacteria bacterium]|nr:hypothetical protein [Alphaproteobacteria bacterium]